MSVDWPKMLSAYLDGELSESARQSLEGVLAGDPELRHQLDEIRSAQEQIRQLDRKTAPRELLSETMARIHESLPTAPPTSGRRGRRWAEEISSYLDGEIDPSRAKRVERKLAKSAAAHRHWEDYRRLQQAVQQLPTLPVPAGVMQNVMKKLAATEVDAQPVLLPWEASDKIVSRGSSPWGWIGAVAGSVAAVLLVGVYLASTPIAGDRPEVAEAPSPPPIEQVVDAKAPEQKPAIADDRLLLAEIAAGPTEEVVDRLTGHQIVIEASDVIALADEIDAPLARLLTPWQSTDREGLVAVLAGTPAEIRTAIGILRELCDRLEVASVWMESVDVAETDAEPEAIGFVIPQGTVDVVDNTRQFLNQLRDQFGQPKADDSADSPAVVAESTPAPTPTPNPSAGSPSKQSTGPSGAPSKQSTGPSGSPSKQSTALARPFRLPVLLEPRRSRPGR